MMKIFLSVFILIISLGSLSAQTFKVNFKGQPLANDNANAIDTLKLLAIMVNFQEDRDGATFGNGKFGSIYSVDYGLTILDPLPHDEQYFNDHLLFVRNYFQKVSNDNLYIEFTVLPDTFSVTQTMRNYSPPPGSEDFTPIGNFAVEAWTLAAPINYTPDLISVLTIFLQYFMPVLVEIFLYPGVLEMKETCHQFI
jgi:hypothetical protein